MIKTPEGIKDLKRKVVTWQKGLEGITKTAMDVEIPAFDV